MNQNKDLNKIIEKSNITKKANKYGNRLPKSKYSNMIILSVVILIIILIILIVSYFYFISPVNKNNEENIYFYVEEDFSSEDIAETLIENKLIKSKLIFKLYTKVFKLDHFVIGKYKASQKNTMKELVDMIVEGDVDNNMIVFKILEGKNLNFIAEEANKVFNIDKSEFLTKVNNKEYLDYLQDKYWFLTDEIRDKRIMYSLEGYLFPDTYFFGSDGTDSELIIETMLNRTEEILQEYKHHYIDSNGKKIENIKVMPIHHVMTLASIVELEANSLESKNEIANVFINRLENNMSLGSDPTTAYAFQVDIFKEDLTQEQLDSENPYNTRGPNMEGKIPVGPISSPSKASINSVFKYKKTKNLFFVSDKYGEIYFTKTDDEHQAIIEELKSTGKWFVYD